MSRTGKSRRVFKNLPVTTVLTGMALAGVALTATGCGGGAPAVGAPPATSHTAAEQAAVTNWLAATNQMWTRDDFAGLDQITTGQMRTIYQSKEQGASLPGNADRVPFQLTGLSITVPCHTGSPAVFVAYADTDVFDLATGLQPVAMVFQRTGGQWKLATAVTRPSGQSWAPLCTTGTLPAVPPVLAPGGYTPSLAQVLTRAATGATQTAPAAAPFTVNDFLAGPGSIPAQFAASIRQDRRAGVTFAVRFGPTPDPTFALPLAGRRGYWVIGAMTQTDAYSAPAGLRATNWPDGSQVATPRPAVVHHQTDTFITTYTAIDPPRSGNATVTLDGFSGWPLTTTAS